MAKLKLTILRLREDPLQSWFAKSLGSGESPVTHNAAHHGNVYLK
jgi:hypothetical protein